VEGGEVRVVGLVLGFGEDLVVLAECDFCAEFEDSGGEGVGGGEGGGVEVEDFLVLALVVGVVDVDEL